MSFISMKDRNQKYRVTITQPADGSPSISLLDENQSERMRMAMGSGNSPELILLDRNSQARVNLGVSTEGRPSLMIGGKNTSTINIGFIDEETPTITWFSRDDRQRIFISDGKLGPLIGLFDKDAVCRTTWAVLPDGTPRFALRNDKGVPTLDFTLGRDGKPQMKDHTK